MNLVHYRAGFSQPVDLMLKKWKFLYYRVIDNDFEDRRYHAEFTLLESKAYKILVQNINNQSENSKVEVAIIGNFSSGKSSFVNSLLGREVCPTAVNPTTSSVTRFVYSDKEKIELKALEQNMNNKVISIEEYWSKSQHKAGETGATEIFFIDYFYPFSALRDISLHDTPGFENPKNKNDHLITEKISEQADVVFVLIDIAGGDISAKLLDRLDKIKLKNNRIQKWFLIVNKADTKPPASIEKIMKELKKKYSEKFDYFFSYSAKDVLAYRDNPYENLMEKLENEISAKIEASGQCKEIQLCLCCEKTGRRGQTYSFFVGDENIKISLAKNQTFIDNKNIILDKLQVIGNDKNRINNNRFNLSLKEYSDVKLNVFETLKNELSKERLKDKVKHKDKLMKKFDKEFSSLIKEINSDRIGVKIFFTNQLGAVRGIKSIGFSLLIISICYSFTT